PTSVEPHPQAPRPPAITTALSSSSRDPASKIRSTPLPIRWHSPSGRTQPLPWPHALQNRWPHEVGNRQAPLHGGELRATSARVSPGGASLRQPPLRLCRGRLCT